MTQETASLWGYLSPSGRLLPSTLRHKAGDCDSALLKTGIKHRGISPDQCSLVNVSVEYESHSQTNGAAATRWEEDAARTISAYLTTGMHHMTPQGQSAIAAIIAGFSSWPTEKLLDT